MRQLLALVFVFAGAASAAPQNACPGYQAAVASGTAPQKLKKFIDYNWKYLMKEYPEWATYVGLTENNDKWTDGSPEAKVRREKEAACALQAIKKIKRAQLKGTDQVNYDLLVYRLQLMNDEIPFDSEYLVMSQLGGLHSDLPDTIASMPSNSKKDVENMIARLEKVPTLVKENEYWMREGLKKKVTPVKMFMERVPVQFDKVLTAKVEDGPFYKPFAELHGNMKPEEIAALQKRAVEVIGGTVYPALKDLREFLVKEYIPGCRETIAMKDLPNGDAWYALNVKSSTTTSMTPGQLHELGLQEVARISGEMAKIREQVKFKGDAVAFNKFLLTDKRFYYTDKEALLAGYRDIAKRIDPELPKLFKTLPRLTYGVREMPEYKAKDSPAAYYMGGSLENGRPGNFEANTYDLKTRPKWGMEALTMHEAVPGHHLQIAIAQEIKDLPQFRRYDGYTAFVEGWGLYAESLGDEMGFYKDPYSKYGQLSYEMWRAVRLVVDTGMHAKGWSRQQAIDYMMAQMPKSRMETEVEIDRYITWPGQALAYKVGQLKFRELRDRAQARLGDAFDVREFHDQVLKNGALPMDVLDKSIDDWISNHKKTKKTPTKEKV
jgi:uncharacterized protein (DUF885 family)